MPLALPQGIKCQILSWCIFTITLMYLSLLLYWVLFKKSWIIVEFCQVTFGSDEASIIWGPSKGRNHTRFINGWLNTRELTRTEEAEGTSRILRNKRNRKAWRQSSRTREGVALADAVPWRGIAGLGEDVRKLLLRQLFLLQCGRNREPRRLEISPAFSFQGAVLNTSLENTQFCWIWIYKRCYSTDFKNVEIDPQS